MHGPKSQLIELGQTEGSRASSGKLGGKSSGRGGVERTEGRHPKVLLHTLPAKNSLCTSQDDMHRANGQKAFSCSAQECYAKQQWLAYWRVGDEPHRIGVTTPSNINRKEENNCNFRKFMEGRPYKNRPRTKRQHINLRSSSSLGKAQLCRRLTLYNLNLLTSGGHCHTACRCSPRDLCLAPTDDEIKVVVKSSLANRGQKAGMSQESGYRMTLVS